MENATQLNAGSGPYFDHWARRCYMAAHRALLDAERSRVQGAGD